MNLVSAVVTVGLFAVVTVGGIQYVGADTEARVRMSNTADTGFQALDAAFRARQAAGLAAPAAAGWEAALFPSFGTKPTPPKDLVWSYGVDATGTWFCLSGTPKQGFAREALDRLTTRYPEDGYRVTDACGGGAKREGSVAATYWVVKASG